MTALGEVDALIDALRPTAESERRRDAVLQYVRECLHAHARLRGARCCVTGSFALKTYLPESDIDMTLLLPPPDGAADGAADADEEWVVAVTEAFREGFDLPVDAAEASQMGTAITIYGAITI